MKLVKEKKEEKENNNYVSERRHPSCARDNLTTYLISITSFFFGHSFQGTCEKMGEN